MSSQFSYELDERQIRIILQDGELENDQSVWNRFEQNAQPDTKSKTGTFNPKLNLSINRSVIVPVIFIIMIGGLSATLFSFVDFKRKDVPMAKNTLQPSTAKPHVPITKLTPSPKINEKSFGVLQQQAVVAATPPVEIKDVTVAKKMEVKVVPAPKSLREEIKPHNATANTGQMNATVAEIKKDPQIIVKKRKGKKAISEEIPTINTSSTILNEQSQEPELELK